MKLVPQVAAIALSLAALVASPAMARPLQCVPYARAHSGIDLHGNAATWWDQAEGTYARGQSPRAGSVLVFKASGAMRVGHVAVVDKIVDERHVVLNHANWSRPGMIETSAMAEDVSANGDWSSVRVWYSPTQSLGLRASPAFGFIYAPGTQGAEPAMPAHTRERFETAFADIAPKG
jgi:hypothetical protein